MTRQPPRASDARQRAAVDPRLLAAASVVAIALLVGSCLALRGEGPLTGRAENDNNSAGTLRLYAAAGLRVPTERALEEYEQAYGVAADLHTHGSGTLFGQLRAETRAGRGPDLYLSAEDAWMQQGRDEGLIREVIPIGEQRPVLIVRPGNPKSITALRDIIDPTKAVAFGIANEGAAIGRKTRAIAKALGLFEAIENQRKTEQETVVALANAVALGSLDAAVVWDITAKLTEGVEIVSLPDQEQRAFDLCVSAVSIGVTASCDRPAEALALARYLGASDKGLVHYEEAGLRVVAGEVWRAR